jgi:hypothetical protein
MCFFYGEELLAPRPTPSRRTTPRRLPVAAYSIYSQLPSILEAVPPSATRGRAMPWGEGHTSMKKYAFYTLIYYSTSALHVSSNVFAHHQEHLNVFTVSGSVHPSCCLMMSRMSWNWILQIVRRVYTHWRHQPEATWVNTTRYYKYIQVLLMMGENIARNM